MHLGRHEKRVFPSFSGKVSFDNDNGTVPAYMSTVLTQAGLRWLCRVNSSEDSVYWPHCERLVSGNKPAGAAVEAAWFSGRVVWGSGGGAGPSVVSREPLHIPAR